MVAMLNPDEEAVLDHLAEVWYLLGQIVTGPNKQADLAELAQPIHVLQSAMLAQAGARCYPDRYRTLGQLSRAATQGGEQ